MQRSETLPLILFAGGVAGSEPERWVGQACRANTADLIARAAQVPRLRPIVVVTPAEGWEDELATMPVEVVPDPPGGQFHFGRRLREVASLCRCERFLYMGGGAGPLLTAPMLASLAERALALERGAVTNNLYSTDFLAVAPATALDSIDLPATDNDLAWRLAAAGLPVEALPATAATRLDLDTPHDLLIASCHPACGPALQRLAASLPLDRQRLERVLSEMRQPRGEVLVYGRVSATAWGALERLPCQTRIYAEERGMRASGRLERGQVHAWLGAFLEQAGAGAFFQSLGRSCTAALLDTRVLFAHLGLRPAAADRFYSDLLLPERVADPAARAFTAAALTTPVPLMLGGQSLVSGGVLALAEVAAPDSASRERRPPAGN